jgi:hypothetical protein
MSDNLKWVRCPICFDYVNEKQLKSVKWFEGHIDAEVDPQTDSSSSSVIKDSATLHTGTWMRMRLMQRPQITTLALPRSPTWPSDLILPHQAPFHFLPDVYNYAKFMLATPAYLIAELTRDLDELAAERRILTSVDDALGIVFVDATEQKIRHQMAKAAALETDLLKESVEKVLREQRDIEERFASSTRRRQDAISRYPDIPEVFLAVQPLHLSHAVVIPTAPSSHRHTRQRRNLNPPPPSTSTYYYYQATSGFPLFLHPLDIKVLFSHFNSYSSFPDTISFPVEAFSEGTVNNDLRKRCKYLAHMPEGADVVFIEADLEGVVGKETLNNFEQALKMRRSKRKEKERKDDRARAKAEERQREKNVLWKEENHMVLPSDRPRPESPREEILPSLETSTQATSGVWGARSFASALHSSPQGPAAEYQASRRAIGPVYEEPDELDVNIPWDELVRKGGSRKNGNRLVVLGGRCGRRR